MSSLSTIRQCLIDLGVHDVVSRGRARVYRTPEESDAAQREQQRVAIHAQRQIKREAGQAGLPQPTFRRGRPRIYATKEESIAAKRAADKICRERQTQRVQDAIRLLAAQSSQNNSEAPPS